MAVSVVASHFKLPDNTTGRYKAHAKFSSPKSCKLAGGIFRHVAGIHRSGLMQWLSVYKCGFLRKSAARSLGLFATIGQVGCIAHVIFEYWGSFVVCNGPSMLPTITPNDVVLTKSVSLSKPTVGDVVIAKSPTNPQRYICKRITAVEGDRVKEKGKSATSSYVPRGHVWLEGDNTENSNDSRIYGPVPTALITSTVTFKIWPVREFGKLPHNQHQT